MKVYISGPISKIPDNNKPAFQAAERLIKARGHEPTSPFAVSPYSPEKTWLDYMKDDLPAMLKCDAVAFLPGWLWSKGGRIEVVLAWALGTMLFRVRAHKC